MSRNGVEARRIADPRYPTSAADPNNSFQEVFNYLRALPEVLTEFERYLQSTGEEFDPLVRAFLAHYQFETIHPFRDGNGRVGRLLLSLSIAEWCKLSSQWLYMSAFFEKRRAEYMDLLLAVSTHGSWDEWIQFCLEGVVEQSVDAEKRCDELLSARRDFHKRLKGGSVRLATMVDGLFESPVVSVKELKKRARRAGHASRYD